MATGYLLYIPAAMLCSTTLSYAIDKVDSSQFLVPVALYSALIPYLVVTIVDMIGVSESGNKYTVGCFMN